MTVIFSRLISSQLMLLVVSSFLFASKIMVAKAAISSGVQPFQLGFSANLGAGMLLLVWVFASGQTIPFGIRHLVLYLVLGIVSFAVPTVLSYVVIDRVGPAYTSTVYSLSPILTMTFAAGFGIERMFLRRFTGVLIGFVGMVTLVQQQFASLEVGATFWVLLGLAIPAFVAIGNIIRTRYWPKNTSALAFSCATLITSSLLVALLAPMFETPTDWEFGTTGALLWIAVLIGVSALSYVSNFRLQKIAGPVVFSQIGYWGTGFGVVLAALLFGDILTITAMIGLVAIVCGGVLANRKRSL